MSLLHRLRSILAPSVFQPTAAEQTYRVARKQPARTFGAHCTDHRNTVSLRRNRTIEPESIIFRFDSFAFNRLSGIFEVRFESGTASLHVVISVYTSRVQFPRSRNKDVVVITRDLGLNQI